MALFRVKRLVEFLGRLWLQSFRRAVLVTVIGIIVASVRVSFSQINESGEGSGFMPTQPDDIGVNGSSLVAICLNSNTRCRDLPAVCLDCNYNDSKNCEYGQDASVSCVPLPKVECQVRPLRRNPLFWVTRLCPYRDSQLGSVAIQPHHQLKLATPPHFLHVSRLCQRR